jgi:hypothetical protein
MTQNPSLTADCPAGPSVPNSDHVASIDFDASLQRRIAARAKPEWSLMNTVAAVERFSAVLAGHTADGHGGLAELAAASRALDNLQAAVDAMARLLLDREQASYREIGTALDISRQAAAARYSDSGSRRPGGQPAALR